MPFFDLLKLAIRNLREAKLRASLTTMGVLVGVAMIVTMVSFGLGLQRNTIARFKELDLFNEMTVFGKTLADLADVANKQGARNKNANSNNNLNSNPNANSNPNTNQVRSQRDDTPNQRGGLPVDQKPERILDDKAVEEISKIPGVISVEPTIFLQVYVRANGFARRQQVGGAIVPNHSQRFKDFAAGNMLTSLDADEIATSEDFVNNFGFANPADAIGKTVDFLAPNKNKDEEEEIPNFMGIPLDDEESTPSDALVAKSFRIVGVLKRPETRGGFRGFLPSSDVYISVKTARAWRDENRDAMNEVAIQLARESGALKEGEQPGYATAVVRVSDPAVLPEVRKKLNSAGFGTFSIMDQLDEIRLVFLIINSALGVLGGISLLVASFGIANTMIMSILERTREIGIMKAIGAEDLEIKLIFFIEASVIGFVGGVLGCIVALGIDALANRLAYRFILQPQGASYVDFFALPPYLWVGAILFAVLVSITAALYPATRAARIDPVKALRHD
jgi:ABC-type antimicrobial peptide transport system permease subunit